MFILGPWKISLRAKNGPLIKMNKNIPMLQTAAHSSSSEPSGQSFSPSHTWLYNTHSDPSLQGLNPSLQCRGTRSDVTVACTHPAGAQTSQSKWISCHLSIDSHYTVKQSFEIHFLFKWTRIIDITTNTTKMYKHSLHITVVFVAGETVIKVMQQCKKS